MGRILAVDYGESRTGLAVSDPFGWSAQGLDTFETKKAKCSVYEKIAGIARDYQVDRIVVGNPLNMDGSFGPRAVKTGKFIEKLKRYIDIEIVLWDERLSSSAAIRTIHETGARTGDNKGLIDKLSAVYILQGYLASTSNSSNK